MLAKRIPACAQPLARFGDNDLAATKLTTARIRKAEHASRRSRTRKPVRAFPHDLRACHDYIVTPARGLTAALLFLPLATTACPIGWTPSPTSATRGSRCFLVPPERSASLFRCVDLCEEHGGAPACIGSAEENAFVTAELAASGGLWLGLYQNETGRGPAKGWGRCVAADAPKFTNWHEGQPDDFDGYQQDCAWVEAATGQWRSLACDGGARFDPRPWRIAELSCLCAHGIASTVFADDLDFADDLEALEATRASNERLLRRRTAVAFAIAAAFAILPTLLLLGWAVWRRLRRAWPTCASAGVQGAATSPSLSAAATATKPAMGTARLVAIRAAPAMVASSSAAVKGVLDAARKSAAGRRLRVSFAVAQMGCALFAIGSVPWIMSGTDQSIEAAVGDQDWWVMPAAVGACLLLLALFPTDARAIRVVSATAVVLSTVLGALTIRSMFVHRTSREYGFMRAALLFAAASALTPTLRCRGDRAMQPRTALWRMWTVGRFYVLGLGVLNAGSNIADFVQVDKNVDHWALAAYSATLLAFAALSTPRNRGRLHRRLGRLSGRGTEAEEAAAIAALVDGSDADAALERAAKLLRCLPASRLLATDLNDKIAAPPAGPTLHERTEPAAMGEVTAFLSHSWSDEDEAPGAKHALVSRWAKRRLQKSGNEPTLWLV